MVELRVNDLVEFDLHGNRVIGTLIRLADENGYRVVRYWSDKIIQLRFYQVWRANLEVMVDGVRIGGRTEDDNELVYDERDGYSYFGTRLSHCYDCHEQLDASGILSERLMGNWEVPRCSVCDDPDNRPCAGCFQSQCICQDIEDARSY